MGVTTRRRGAVTVTTPEEAATPVQTNPRKSKKRRLSHLFTLHSSPPPPAPSRALFGDCEPMEYAAPQGASGSWSELPAHVVHLVLQKLWADLKCDSPDLRAFRSTCKYWSQLFDENAERLRPRGKASLPVPRGATADAALALRYPRLTDVDLTRYLEVGDDVAVQLSQLPGLTRLHLGESRQVTDAGLAAFADHPALAVLAMLDCEHVTDAGLSVVGATWGPLRVLELKYCHRATDEGVRALLGGRQPATLERLTLTGAENLTNHALQALLPCTKLTHLNLEGAGRMDSIGAEVLAQVTSLVTLDLSYCTGLTDMALELLWPLTRLEGLKLKGVYGVSGACFCAPSAATVARRVRAAPEAAEAAAALPFAKLTSLCLSSCRMVSASRLEEFLPHLTALRCLDLSYVSIAEDARPLTALARLTALEALDLSFLRKSQMFSNASDLDLPAVAPLQQLRDLRLNGKCLQPADLHHLRPLEALERLELSANLNVDDKALRALRHLPRLAELQVNGCTAVTAAGVEWLKAHVPRLMVRGLAVPVGVGTAAPPSAAPTPAPEAKTGTRRTAHRSNSLVNFESNARGTDRRSAK